MDLIDAFDATADGIDHLQADHRLGQEGVSVNTDQSLEELAIELKIKHVMLDNFSPQDIKTALNIKPAIMSYEISGGINLENMKVSDIKKFNTR